MDGPYEAHPFPPTNPGGLCGDETITSCEPSEQLAFQQLVRQAIWSFSTRGERVGVASPEILVLPAELRRDMD